MSAALQPRDLVLWSAGRWDPVDPRTPVRGVSNDSRSLPPGSLYVALKGERWDGHSFVEAAFEAGACGAVVAEDYPARGSAGRPLLRVADTAAALAAMARGYRRAVDPLVIGVTGSVGKSTVKEMLAQILRSRLAMACTRGNWNNQVGLPLSLLAMPGATRVGVFELGVNHRGEMDPLCRILEPDWGVVTNVGPVHVEFFGTVESIAAEKARLLAALPADGLAFLDRDGRYFELLAAQAACRCVTVSFIGDADYVCQTCAPGGRDALVCETSSGARFPFRLPVPGRHHVRNALMAIAVARACEVEWDAIHAALAAFTPLPMRWQNAACDGVRLINDAYNANPLSMQASLDAFAAEVVDGGKWLVLSGMLELGAAERAEHLALGRALAAGDWAGLVTVGPLGALIAAGAVDAGMAGERVFRCGTNEEAAAVLCTAAAPGDAILLKASRGMRLEEVEASFCRNRGGSSHAESHG